MHHPCTPVLRSYLPRWFKSSQPRLAGAEGLKNTVNDQSPVCKVEAPCKEEHPKQPLVLPGTFAIFTTMVRQPSRKTQSRSRRKELSPLGKTLTGVQAPPIAESEIGTRAALQLGPTQFHAARVCAVLSLWRCHPDCGALAGALGWNSGLGDPRIVRRTGIPRHPGWRRRWPPRRCPKSAQADKTGTALPWGPDRLGAACPSARTRRQVSPERTEQDLAKPKPRTWQRLREKG